MIATVWLETHSKQERETLKLIVRRNPKLKIKTFKIVEDKQKKDLKTFQKIDLQDTENKMMFAIYGDIEIKQSSENEH